VVYICVIYLGPVGAVGPTGPSGPSGPVLRPAGPSRDVSFVAHLRWSFAYSQGPSRESDLEALLALCPCS
jgi:hypothetical protein